MHLLRRIETYLSRSATPPARFGREAMGDPCFVFDLRNGRQLRPATVRRVTEWLAQAEAAGE